MSRGVAAGLALVLAACASAPPRLADAVAFDWQRFGAELATAGLPTPTDERARAVSIAAVQELERLGVEPNCDSAGRERAQQAFGDTAIGTCGHLARSLRDALRGSGIASERVHIVTGLRVRPTLGGRPRPYLGPDWLNGDHATAMVRCATTTLAFDPWLHGRAAGSFAGFADGPCCGIPASAWLARMRSDGYSEFHLDDDPPSADIDQVLAPTPEGDR